MEFVVMNNFSHFGYSNCVDQSLFMDITLKLIQEKV